MLLLVSPNPVICNSFKSVTIFSKFSTNLAMFEFPSVIFVNSVSIVLCVFLILNIFFSFSIICGMPEGTPFCLTLFWIKKLLALIFSYFTSQKFGSGYDIVWYCLFSSIVISFLYWINSVTSTISLPSLSYLLLRRKHLTRVFSNWSTSLVLYILFNFQSFEWCYFKVSLQALLKSLKASNCLSLYVGSRVLSANTLSAFNCNFFNSSTFSDIVCAI